MVRQMSHKEDGDLRRGRHADIEVNWKMLERTRMRTEQDEVQRRHKRNIAINPSAKVAD